MCGKGHSFRKGSVQPLCEEPAVQLHDPVVAFCHFLELREQCRRELPGRLHIARRDVSHDRCDLCGRRLRTHQAQHDLVHDGTALAHATNRKVARSWNAVQGSANVVRQAHSLRDGSSTPVSSRYTTVSASPRPKSCTSAKKSTSNGNEPWVDWAFSWSAMKVHSWFCHLPPTKLLARGKDWRDPPGRNGRSRDHHARSP